MGRTKGVSRYSVVGVVRGVAGADCGMDHGERLVAFIIYCVKLFSLPGCLVGPCSVECPYLNCRSRLCQILFRQLAERAELTCRQLLFIAALCNTRIGGGERVFV